MRAWAYMLGGPIVWAVHFFVLYAISSVFLTSTLARILVLIVSALCIAADAWLLRAALPIAKSNDSEEFGRWAAHISALGAALSLVAVTWQSLPAVLI